MQTLARILDETGAPIFTLDDVESFMDRRALTLGVELVPKHMRGGPL